MSIPLGLFLLPTVPMAVLFFVLFIWLIKRIHPVTRQNLMIISLGLGISIAAMFWQGYQKYVQSVSVGSMTRLLSFIGIAVLVSGVYLHSIERQKSKTRE